jgi:hypothetical protein
MKKIIAGQTHENNIDVSTQSLRSFGRQDDDSIKNEGGDSTIRRHVDRV